MKIPSEYHISIVYNIIDQLIIFLLNIFNKQRFLIQNNIVLPIIIRVNNFLNTNPIIMFIFTMDIHID